MYARRRLSQHPTEIPACRCYWVPVCNSQALVPSRCRSADEWIYSVLFRSLPVLTDPSPAATEARSHAQVFTWVLWIRTQVLVLVQQAPNTLSHLAGPWLIFCYFSEETNCIAYFLSKMWFLFHLLSTDCCLIYFFCFYLLQLSAGYIGFALLSSKKVI